MRMAAMTLVAALAAMSTSATAQATAQASAASNAEKVAQYSTDQLKSELNLTAEQVPKVQKINHATATSLQQLIHKYDADTSAQAASALTKGLVAAVRTNQTELKKILTPAQWTQHQGNKAQRLAMSQTEAMASNLDLTREQILDVQRINMDGAAKGGKGGQDSVGDTAVEIRGTLHVTRDITGDRNILARQRVTGQQQVVGGNVTMTTHRHMNVQGGLGTSGPPQPGS